MTCSAALAGELALANRSTDGGAPEAFFAGSQCTLPDSPWLRTCNLGLAFLFPDRRALATATLRLERYPVQGASDHGVSEAIYLADPEGNGVELYADRPREAWPRNGDSVRMFTRPLALRVLLSQAEQTGDDYAIPPMTRLGHVHLSVSRFGPCTRFDGRPIGDAGSATRPSRFLVFRLRRVSSPHCNEYLASPPGCAACDPRARESRAAPGAEVVGKDIGCRDEPLDGMSVRVFAFGSASSKSAA